MPSKAQFMISVDEAERDRLDALRIVMATSRAEVGRLAWVTHPGGLGGIGYLEVQQAARLGRLSDLATRYGYPNWNALVWHLTETYGQRMPTLEALEDPRNRHIKRRRKTDSVPDAVTPAFLAAD